MQSYSLLPHPDSPRGAVQRIDVALTRQGNVVEARFDILGAIEALRIPSVSTSRRRDELWRHTCCELFIRSAAASNYCEFNFSPSTEWAAYSFAAYRTGMQPLDIEAPTLEWSSTAAVLQLQSQIRLPLQAEPWRVAASCVIEESNGAISYWALKHPAGKADFHHSDAFIVELSA